MKKLINFGKILESFLISSIKTVFSISAVLLLSKYNVKMNKNNNRNMALVLGNGPSLKKDFIKIYEKYNRSEVSIMCVNDFALSEQFVSLKPEYYVFLDPFYWEDKLCCDDASLRDKLINRIKENVNWKMIVFAPFEMQASSSFVQNSLSQNNNISFIYYNRTPVTGFERFIFYSCKKKYGIFSGSNVLIAALQNCINLGYQTIHLYGADTSLHEDVFVNDYNEVFVGQVHFYDDYNVEKKLYSRSYINKKSIGIEDLFEIWANTFRSYKILNKYAIYQGTNIINCSSKSFIDAFQRDKS